MVPSPPWTDKMSGAGHLKLTNQMMETENNSDEAWNYAAVELSTQKVADQTLCSPPASSAPLPRRRATDSRACFDGVLAELRDEQSVFQPPFADQEVSWFKTSQKQQLPTTDLNLLSSSDNVERKWSIEAIQGKNPDFYNTGTYQLFDGNSFASGNPAVEAITKHSKKPSSKETDVNKEKLHDHGTLSVRVMDKYPCFQVPCGRNEVEFTPTNTPSEKDPQNSFLDGAILMAGSFPEVEELPSLTKDPSDSAPWHKIQDLLSAAAVHESPCLSSDILNDGNGGTVDGTRGSHLKANIISNPIEKISATPCSLTACFDEAPNDKLVSPKKPKLSSTAINVQHCEMKRNPVLQLASSSNLEEIPHPGRPLPTSIPTSHNTHQKINQVSIPGESSHLVTVSQENKPWKPIFLSRPTAFQQSSLRRSSQEVSQDVAHLKCRQTSQGKAFPASSNHPRSPCCGRIGGCQMSGNRDTSLSCLPSVYPKHSANGESTITPTSVILDKPFVFEKDPHRDSNTALSTACNAQNIGTIEEMGLQVGNRNDKHGTCEARFTQGTETMKSRTAMSHSTSEFIQELGEEGTSKSSGDRKTLQIRHKSQDISICTPPKATPGHSPSISEIPPQNAISGVRNCQGQRPGEPIESQIGPRKTGGLQSEATFWSPSKKRSINVREETDEMPKRFICTDCQAAYAFKENCERHFKVFHQGRNVYYCPHCPASYLQAKTMRCHIDKKHHVLKGDISIFPCYWCQFKANTVKAWSIHVSEKHPGYKNVFRGTAV